MGVETTQKCIHTYIHTDTHTYVRTCTHVHTDAQVYTQVYVHTWYSVPVFGQSLSADEDREGVPSVVRLVHLTHLHRVVHQVVVYNLEGRGEGKDKVNRLIHKVACGTCADRTSKDVKMYKSSVCATNTYVYRQVGR